MKENFDYDWINNNTVHHNYLINSIENIPMNSPMNSSMNSSMNGSMNGPKIEIDWSKLPTDVSKFKNDLSNCLS